MTTQPQPPVSGQPAATEPGSMTPVPGTPPAATQPGAAAAENATTQEIPGTTETKPVAKTYTEEDVKKRESDLTSKLQAETATYRQYLARMAMQQQIQDAQAQENAAREKDKTDVEQGLITDQEAETRQSKRAEAAQIEYTLRAQRQQAEQLGRITLAHDLATEYGISAEELIKDASIKNPADMIRKAGKIALSERDEKLRAATVKPENYDKGPGAGSVIGDFSKMSPMEKVKWAIEHQK